MRDFHLIVDDERQSAPGLMILCTRDEARARTVAERVLAQSRHHLSVEVREHGRPLFSIARADPCAA